MTGAHEALPDEESTVVIYLDLKNNRIERVRKYDEYCRDQADLRAASERIRRDHSVSLECLRRMEEIMRFQRSQLGKADTEILPPVDLPHVAGGQGRTDTDALNRGNALGWAILFAAAVLLVSLAIAVIVKGCHQPQATVEYQDVRH
jgi:hypothetical protein